MTRPRILLLDGVYRRQHYTELQAAFDAEWLIELTPALERVATSAIDLAVVSQENFSKTTVPLCRLIEKGVPTLHLADGISEWRFIWENHDPELGEVSLPLFQPVLSHKITCIGRSQTRFLESWGNLGKCELVGLPRLDALLGRRPRQRKPSEPARLLIMTAKMPAFTANQLRRVEQSLQDLKTWIERPRSKDQVAVEAVWRLTMGLDAKLGVKNEFSDDSGRELARVLDRIDAVVTTPSTAMLEAMLQGIPVALLDYHNCPHYVPGAWSITAPHHLDQIIPELLNPSPAKMLYQDTVLHDALQCRMPAMPRMIRLIEEMISIARECRKAGRPIAFPRRILSDEHDGHHLPEERFDMCALYPDQASVDVMDRNALRLEIGHLRFQHQQDVQNIESLKKRLATRDPVLWLRALYRAVPLPNSMRRFLSDRYRKIRRRRS